MVITRFSQIAENLKEKFFTDFFSNPYDNIVAKNFLTPESDFDLLTLHEGHKLVGKISFYAPPTHSDYLFWGHPYFSPDSNLKESFSLFENVLLDSAKKRGRKWIIGPIHFSTWFSNRLRISGFELNCSWAPANDEKLPKTLLELRHKKDQEYFSKFYRNADDMLRHTKKAYDFACDNHYEFRQLNLNDPSEIEILYHLNISSFDQNYLYEHITLDCYKNTIYNFLNDDLLRYTYLLRKHGKDLAYSYCFVDENNTIIVKSILTLPEARSSGISSALIYKSLYKARQDGITKAAGALVRRGNISEKFFNHLDKAEFEHTYCLFKKEVL